MISLSAPPSGAPRTRVWSPHVQCHARPIPYIVQRLQHASFHIPWITACNVMEHAARCAGARLRRAPRAAQLACWPPRVSVCLRVEDETASAAGGPAHATDVARPGAAGSHVRFAFFDGHRVVCAWAPVAVGVVAVGVIAACACLKPNEKGRVSPAPCRSFLW